MREWIFDSFLSLTYSTLDALLLNVLWQALLASDVVNMSGEYSFVDNLSNRGLNTHILYMDPIQ